MDPLARVDSVLSTRLKVEGGWIYHSYGIADEETCQMEGRKLQEAIPGLECMVSALESFPEKPPKHDPAQIEADPYHGCC